MAYFPTFIQLQDKKILIVGGGNVALEKLEKLLDFTHDIVLIAESFSEKILTKIQEKKLSFFQRTYEVGDIANFAIVIIAVDDIPLQEAIFLESKKYKCLCNAVDSVKYCDFIFPSYVKKDDLTIAISTSGTSPAFAKHFKLYLANILPKSIGSFLKEMKQLRQTIPKGKERMKMLDEKAKDYVSKL